MSAPSSSSKPSVWNVPNALTVLRIALVPVFVVVFVADDGGSSAMRIWAAVIFVVAIATDWLDGDLARRQGLVTDFGKIADPIADKALTGAALICLSLLGELAWWVTVVIMVREIGITVLRFVIIRRGVMPASRGGKLKTALQSVGLVLLILPLTGLLHLLGLVVMYAALAVTVVTGIDYLAQAWRIWRGSDVAA
ncbi:MAG TPA: CDP-diacylglycerol--glycerol-3-phosphate 3-phosphatidyltransferase [Ornithinimicrobium sp.]|uniref:CDP-diacylglycerol--glycerol-3-phosphate 3-phosphatidyltransferase n=1 Tax=Ornithinimicrobium sp. TaxID=1977084 RepID=UPI002B4A9C1E|nr:CDP-diacylglycerol--glycerol-3-phosphate 3-phosphatidyltransferase [Ornithinimicrobium sp.]HKJ10968.1 CDP-diacylglycerol--glycerol-3-phosphate 3-phosphatidyltransferase [Ornithinimicrobium sp.]